MCKIRMLLVCIPILRELDNDLADWEKESDTVCVPAKLQSSPEADDRSWGVLLITEKLKGKSDNLSIY